MLQTFNTLITWPNLLFKKMRERQGKEREVSILLPMKFNEGKEKDKYQILHSTFLSEEAHGQQIADLQSDERILKDSQSSKATVSI